MYWYFFIVVKFLSYFATNFVLGQRFALLVSKVAMAAIIKDFVFDVTDKTPVPLRFDPGSLFVQNRGGLHLKVTKV